MIPLKGPSAVQRRRVRKVQGDAHFVRQNKYHPDKWYLEDKVRIKRIRRVVTEGTDGRLWASERPCCEKDCSACSGRGPDGHAHRLCETNEYTRCMLLQVTPAARSQLKSRGDLAREGDLLGEGAEVGDVLAAETNSNTTHFLLVKAVEAGACDVPLGYSCPRVAADANFEYPRNKQAIRAVLLKPVTTARGDASITRYEEHAGSESFLVPCSYLRLGKVRLVRHDAPRRAAPSRAAAAAPGAAPPRPCVFELPAALRARIVEKCGAY